MKSDVMGAGTTTGKKDPKELTNETKESNAVDSKPDNSSQRSFGLVDLWNLQKRQKTTASMSRWL